MINFRWSTRYNAKRITLNAASVSSSHHSIFGDFITARFEDLQPTGKSLRLEMSVDDAEELANRLMAHVKLRRNGE